MNEQAETTTSRGFAAERVRARMDDMYPSLREFAKHINEKPTTVHNIVSGRSQPSLALAVKMAYGLGWTLEYFVQMFFSEHPLVEVSQLSTISSTHRELNKDLILDFNSAA